METENITPIKRTCSELFDDTLNLLIQGTEFPEFPFSSNQINYPLFQLEPMMIKSIVRKGYLHHSWSIEENICLVGIIFDIFFERGWLKGKNKQISVWTEILQRYETHLEYFYKFYTKYNNEKENNIEFAERSVSSIKIHFKYLKAEMKKFKQDNLFQVLYRVWNNYIQE
eukprot:snap_masked-scaffold_34-processed-gene-0.34-mRNA-1 protein AED:1.00 eAED:1.00 QI:0/-1/0/0/-1/1/1/0/169